MKYHTRAFWVWATIAQLPHLHRRLLLCLCCGVSYTYTSGSSLSNAAERYVRPSTSFIYNLNSLTRMRSAWVCKCTCFNCMCVCVRTALSYSTFWMVEYESMHSGRWKTHHIHDNFIIVPWCATESDCIWSIGHQLNKWMIVFFVVHFVHSSLAHIFTHIHTDSRVNRAGWTSTVCYHIDWTWTTTISRQWMDYVNHLLINSSVRN